MKNEMDVYIERKSDSLACGLVLIFLSLRFMYLLFNGEPLGFSELAILNIIILTRAFMTWRLRRKMVGDEGGIMYAPKGWQLVLIGLLLFIVFTNLVVYLAILLL